MNKIINSDWMENDIADKSIQLIISDPPYFETKGDFDFKWLSFQDYLKDVEMWAIECKRILAENGTLFWFGSSKKIAYSQIIFDKYFGLVNNLVWEKAEADGLFGSTGSKQLRSFPNSTERILMYAKKEKDISGDWYKNIRKYLIDEKTKTGMTLTDLNEILVGKRKSDLIAKRYFGVSQWELPTEEMYLKLQTTGHFKKPYRTINSKFKGLKEEYEELRKEYEELRRPFDNFKKSTEILKVRFKPTEYNHETVKPEKLASLLINTCSNKGDLVLVPFVGSGTECEAAFRYDRKFIGYEIDKKYYKIAKQRLNEEMIKIKLEL